MCNMKCIENEELQGATENPFFSTRKNQEKKEKKKTEKEKKEGEEKGETEAAAGL